MKINEVIAGDNLLVMSQIPSHSVDLIYCDILSGVGRKMENLSNYQFRGFPIARRPFDYSNTENRKLIAVIVPTHWHFRDLRKRGEYHDTDEIKFIPMCTRNTVLGMRIHDYVITELAHTNANFLAIVEECRQAKGEQDIELDTNATFFDDDNDQNGKQTA